MRLEPGNAQRRYDALSRRNNCDGAVVAGLIHGGGREVSWLRSGQLLKGIPAYKEWKKFSAVAGKPGFLTCEFYEVDELVKEYHQCRERFELKDERLDADESGTSFQEMRNA